MYEIYLYDSLGSIQEDTTTIFKSFISLLFSPPNQVSWFKMYPVNKNQVDEYLEEPFMLLPLSISPWLLGSKLLHFLSMFSLSMRFVLLKV